MCVKVFISCPTLPLYCRKVNEFIHYFVLHLDTMGCCGEDHDSQRHLDKL